VICVTLTALDPRHESRDPPWRIVDAHWPPLLALQGPGRARWVWTVLCEYEECDTFPIISFAALSIRTWKLLTMHHISYLTCGVPLTFPQKGPQCVRTSCTVAGGRLPPAASWVGTFPREVALRAAATGSWVLASAIHAPSSKADAGISFGG
jgi:hypothetical protein